ncbi:MAG: hypothetical protein ABL929_09225, partial [Ferruginibacter sp.]
FHVSAIVGTIFSPAVFSYGSQYNFTSIFISHNLSVIHYISDNIMVMHKGKIIESGTANEIMFSAKEKYTQTLLEAVPKSIWN